MPLDVNYSKGEAVGAAVAATGKLPNLNAGERRGKFGMYAHAASWEFTGDEWLPVVKCIAAKAGLNGAVEHNDTPFRAQMAQDGYTDITYHPTLVAKYGGPERSLVRRQSMQDGGAHYMPPWEGVGLKGGKSRRGVDDELHRNFRRDVIDIIGPMAEETCEDVIAPWVARIASLRLDRSGGVNIPKRIEELEAKVEAARAAWIVQFDKPKPKKGAA